MHKDFIQINDMSKQHNELTIKMTLGSDLPYFKGHFEGRPILPGVAQIEMAINFAMEHLALMPNQLGKVNYVKFSHIIKPEQELTLHISLTQSVMLFEYSNTEKLCSKAKIMLREISQ